MGTNLCIDFYIESNIAVCKHDALRIACGAGSINQGTEVIRPDSRLDPVHFAEVAFREQHIPAPGNRVIVERENFFHAGRLFTGLMYFIVQIALSNKTIFDFRFI